MATLPEVVQARRRRPFACELRDTDLQLRPTFQQTIFRAADTAAPERRRTNRAIGSDRTSVHHEVFLRGEPCSVRAPPWRWPGQRPWACWAAKAARAHSNRTGLNTDQRKGNQEAATSIKHVWIDQLFT